MAIEHNGLRVAEKNNLRKVLYLVNLYGSTLHKMFIKYLRESGSARITIIELPSVKLLKGKLHIDAFILNGNEQTFSYKLHLPFPFPQFFVFASQYVFNFYVLFKLLNSAGCEKFDICIAESNYNGALAFFLKKIKKCRFSIFMNGDILPQTNNYLQKAPSFINKLLNSFLIKSQYILRRIAYRNDLVWYPNEKIKKWDAERGFYTMNSFIASSPVDYEIIKKNIAKQRLPNTICYIGGLYEYSGLDIIISSIKKVKEILKDIKVFIVGGSSLDVERYQKLARSYGLEENIKFYGYIPDEKTTLDILASSMAGLALYKPTKDNVSLYTDVSKVKAYINAGLPVIITRNGPDVWKEIERFNAGVVVNYNESDIAKNIIRISTDTSEYNLLKEGIIKFGRTYDYKERGQYIWDRIVTGFEADNGEGCKNFYCRT